MIPLSQKVKHSEEFIVPVMQGTKRQTVRNWAVKPGTLLLHMGPSETVEMISICSRCELVMMDDFGFDVNGKDLTGFALEEFAVADGFKNSDAMFAFLKECYGYPFAGHVIYWDAAFRGHECRNLVFKSGEWLYNGLMEIAK